MEDKNTIMSSVMEKIEKEALAPKPRWEFLLKNYMLWIAGLIALGVGSVATSGVMFAFNNGDWLLSRRLGVTVFEHCLKIMPFLWIALLGVFILLAIYQMKHTRYGYTYPLWVLVLGNISASVIFGCVLYLFGYAHIADTLAGRWLPSYQAIEEKREAMWVRPERGLLAGIVLGTATDGVYVVEDFLGNKWEISDDRLGELDRLVLSTVEEVGIVGNMTGPATFEACAVRPWDIRGEHPPLRQEMMRQRMFERAGSVRPVHDMMPHEQGQYNLLRVRLSERNIPDLRTIECERSTTSPQIYPGLN